MKTVACRIDLGFTRIAGYTLFDQDTFEFQETTPRDVTNLIKSKQLNGLVFDGTGKVVPDIEGWNMGNIKIKSGVGNYRNFNTESPKGDTVYSVVRAIDIDGVGRIYEVINNRCARVFYFAKQLVALAQFSWVGGIKVNEETDEIELCSGVKVEDQSDRDVFELGDKVFTKKTLQDVFMQEMFSGKDITGENEPEQRPEQMDSGAGEMPAAEPIVDEDTWKEASEKWNEQKGSDDGAGAEEPEPHEDEMPFEADPPLVNPDAQGEAGENVGAGEEHTDTGEGTVVVENTRVGEEASGDEGETEGFGEPAPEEKDETGMSNGSHEGEETLASENGNEASEVAGAEQEDKPKAPRRSTTSRTSKKKK